MNDERGRPDANNCFVCGPSNPEGLRIDYRMDGDVCRAAFTPRENHVGYDRMLHGGIMFSTLDDVMANWLFLQGARAHTAKCEIRYRRPVTVGTPLQLEGRLVRRKGRVAMMTGTLSRADDATVVADAQASFMIVDPGPLE
ncbi:MAG: PaaI family thioesterase [Gammaproteobacteria bacterium]